MSKIWRAVFFPHKAVLIISLLLSALGLVLTMSILGPKSPYSYAVYAFSAYTLTIWCVRMPEVIRWIQRFKNENKLVRRYFEDERLRVLTSLYAGIVFNVAYAVLLLGLGIYNQTLWYSTMSAYYFMLVLMRFFLLRYSLANKRCENMRAELYRYLFCGIVFLLMNLTLSVMLFFMIYFERTFRHHEITTIVLAAHTFTTLILAIVNSVKYRKYNSPVYSASRSVSLAGACVSMLTLESTMLTAFGDGNAESERLCLALSGAAVSAVIVAMAIYMIIISIKKLKQIGKKQYEFKGNQ